MGGLRASSWSRTQIWEPLSVCGAATGASAGPEGPGKSQPAAGETVEAGG